jgi:hypothetical protein
MKIKDPIETSAVGKAKAGFIAGHSSFAAVPGRQHNCLPFTLIETPVEPL